MPEIELFDKQAQFFEAENRINAYVAGIQSGKSTGGALKHVAKGILKYTDPLDNFIIAADTYKTLSQATIPAFMAYAKPYGKLSVHSGEFKTQWGSTVYLRTATHPESMEGITRVRRIWLDEGGKVSRYFFENVMGRAAFFKAPIDITTTPYAMNWLAEICEGALKGTREDVSLTQCRSIDSPYFPKDEYLRQKKLLDPRRFAMKYEGLFGKMEGLVYQNLNLCPSFQLPTGTKYYAGVDWGYNPDPFAIVVRAVTPDRLHYRVAEYYRNFLTISGQVQIAKSLKSIYGIRLFLCDPSQPGSIQEFNLAGCPARGAQNDIRLGIDKHDDLIREKRFWIFDDMNPLGIDEYSTYHYPEEKELAFDKDSKELIPVDKNNHGCDADRYLTLELERESEKQAPKIPQGRDMTPPRDNLKRLEWLKKGGNRGPGIL